MKKLKAFAILSIVTLLSTCGLPEVDSGVGLELGPVTRSGLFQVSAPLTITNPFKFKLCVTNTYPNAIRLTLVRIGDGALAYPQNYYPGEENPVEIPHYYGNPTITHPVFILDAGESVETTAQVDLRHLDGGIHIREPRFNQLPTPNGVYGFKTSITAYRCSAVNLERVDGAYQFSAPIKSRIGKGYLSSAVSEGQYIDFDAIRATFDPEALAERNYRNRP